MFAVAGCQSGGKGALGVGGDPQAAAAADTRVKASDLLAYCPIITLRDGTAYFNTYAKGGKKAKKADAEDGSAAAASDDSADIVYQAAITDVTRDCSRSGGSLTMNVAVAGKVVPGPKGGAGSITMPIRIVVVHGSDVLYSQLHQYKLQVTDTSAATQFVFNDPNVTIPEPTDKGYQVFAGYDEGPPSRKK
ncbi:MAG: hypothetical protein WA973_22765 [Mesorhizobium sp.]